jgi:hypothetical protein
MTKNVWFRKNTLGTEKYLAGKFNHAAGKLVPLPRNIHESVNPTRFQQGPEQKNTL